jgi:hypothetical protein
MVGNSCRGYYVQKMDALYGRELRFLVFTPRYLGTFDNENDAKNALLKFTQLS